MAYRATVDVPPDALGTKIIDRLKGNRSAELP